MNRFLFAAWNIGFAFGAARLVEFKLVSIETKWRYEMLRRLRWQHVSPDMRDCFLHFDERHVAAVGIELWMSP